MKSDFSVKLTFHDQTIICHYIKKNIIKQEKKVQKSMEGTKTHTKEGTSN